MYHCQPDVQESLRTVCNSSRTLALCQLCFTAGSSASMCCPAHLFDSLPFLRSLCFLGDADLLPECVGDAFLRLTGLGDRLRLGLDDSRRLTLSGD